MLTGDNYSMRNPRFRILIARESLTGEGMVKYTQVCINKLNEDGVYVFTIKHRIPRLVTKFRLKF